MSLLPTPVPAPPRVGEATVGAASASIQHATPLSVPVCRSVCTSCLPAGLTRKRAPGQGRSTHEPRPPRPACLFRKPRGTEVAVLYDSPTDLGDIVSSAVNPP